MTTGRFRPGDIIYRALLLALPADFRREFGDDMLQMFADHRRETRGRPLRLWLWLHATRDVLREAARARRSAGQARRTWRQRSARLAQDLRYGARSLRKSPGFTVIAVVTLALGIGANTAIFTVIDALMLRTLPVDHAEDIVQIGIRNPKRGTAAGQLTTALWDQLRERQDVFAGLAAWDDDQFNLSRGGAVNYAHGLWVTGEYFSTLTLRPAAGHLIGSSDDVRGCAGVAVLGYDFWQSHYGGAESAVGSTLTLKGRVFPVVGVAPRGFHGLVIGKTFDVALPECATALMDDPSNARLTERGWSWLQVVARLKPGVTARDAGARLAAISPPAFAEALPPHWGTEEKKTFLQKLFIAVPAMSGVSSLRAEFRSPLRILMTLVAIVLLVACANVSGLLLARGAAQRREISVQLALGASRGQVIQQLLVQCLLLSALGAAAGALLAQWGTVLLLRGLSTAQNAVFLDLAPDWRVLCFTAGIALVTAAIFGVLPAIRSSRSPLALAMRGTAAPSDGRGRLRQGIVAGQVALSLVLLVAAGLILRSFTALLSVGTGFDSSNVLLASVDLRQTRISAAARIGAYDLAEDRLRQVPGVVSAGRSLLSPVQGSTWSDGVTPDTPNPPPLELADAYINAVSPGHFTTLRMPILAGRNFTRADDLGAEFVAVVNRTFARRFFGDLDPIGRTFKIGELSKHPKSIRIVGIVADAKYQSLREPALPTVFLPATQEPDPNAFETFEIRTAAAPAMMTRAVQDAIVGIDKDIPIEFTTLAGQIDDSIVRDRLLAGLSGFFGIVALLLAVVGLYGTVSYLVNLRQAEFGVRLALGARALGIVSLVLRDVAWITGTGLAVGVTIAWLMAGTLKDLLFGLGARDALTLCGAVLVLGVAAAAAGYVPARRAARVDPLVALRAE